ncbi:MAG TPA: MOSC N-terminal beta barrel domain-containing protein [Acidimicrobiales bacterium]|nr:MOSC N-terminal beta barrel domain-containing protein [Acidimicrobiales bacterium]
MRVDAIWRYPLKSAQGEPVNSSSVTELGLEWDRQLAVVDVETRRPLTGRREPKLLLLSAAVADGRVRIASPEGRALDSDGELSDWLGRAVRLARPPTDAQPQYDYPLDNEDESGPWGVWSGPTGVWHDSTRTRVSIVSTASLRAWPVRRFRPNLVVDGAGEDDLVGRRIGVGSVVLDVTKRIDRCVMVSRPQPGGIERDLTVLRTVLRETDGFLGVGALVAATGEVRRGDELIVEG